MFNPKISGIAAGMGFILSFLLGLITGASFPLVLIRALIFAALFFALSGIGHWVIEKYLPELLDTVRDRGEVPTLGAQVDISVGDGDINPSLDISLNDFMENPDESGGDALDQNDEDSYTGLGDLDETPNLLESAVEGVDILPDLDLMSGAFGPGSVAAGEDGESAASTGGTSGGLASTGSLFDVESKVGPEKKGIEGEFAGKNAEEMASAIQTILKREDKG
jgi:hypothetical protein